MTSKISKKINVDSERGARRQLIEELFNDFYHSRHQVYWMNFTRGIFFGFGTILGGTVLVALIVGLLGQLVGFPVICDFIRSIIETMQRV